MPRKRGRNGQFTRNDEWDAQTLTQLRVTDDDHPAQSMQQQELAEAYTDYDAQVLAAQAQARAATDAAWNTYTDTERALFDAYMAKVAKIRAAYRYTPVPAITSPELSDPPDTITP